MRRHGLSRKLNKDWKQRCRERRIVQEGVIQERLIRKKREQRNPAELFADICQSRLLANEITQPHLRRLSEAINAQRAPHDPKVARPQTLQLLLHLHGQRANFFDTVPVVSEFGMRIGNTFVEALVLIAAHYRHWLRPLESWKPRTHNARRQFASLLRHLFAQYDDVPLFFDSVWFDGRTPDSGRHRTWFLHVGRGDSVRHCDLPILLTKKMAHHFMHAPDDLIVDKALRWGQVLGLAGDERLARAIIATRLGDSFDNDDFWTTVILWFIANPMLDRAHVGPVIDYLQDQRFTPVIECAGPGCRQELPPPQPSLTLRGRTPESLLRKVEAWHRKLASDNTHQVGQWNPTGIDEYEFIEGSEANRTLKFWTIRELLSSKALTAEGRQLKHCVASYARSCIRGHCSIWTLEVDSFEGHTKALTIEVRNQQRMICQARGKLNRLPTDKERNIMRRWAVQAGLTITSYV